MIYPPNIKEIRKFAEEYGIDVKYLLGEKYESGLDLFSVKSLPDNIVFNVGGWLDLSSVKSLPDNVVFNVGGDLDLFSVESLPANIVFNVGRYVDLNSVEFIHSSVKFVNYERLVLPEDKKVKIIW